ncbi:MAG: GNAT family N-acetyltransferase [Christensenellales bacterium]|jgi:ribosomal protein S18 acetylase RimI-like enzyme
MYSIVFKKASSQDVKEIRRITRKAFENYAKEIGKKDKVDALHETNDQILQDIQYKHVYRCEVDGETAGAVRFEVLDQSIAYLSRLAVDPDIQSLGIGGLLLEKVRQECVALGVRAITLYTASKMRSAVAFYLKNGYYIHSITRDKEYIRAFMVNELTNMDELFDYESIVQRGRQTAPLV